MRCRPPNPARQRNPSRTVRAGFSILVLMVVLALLGAFALVATRLIAASLRVHADAGQILGERRMLDAALDQLRRDVWSATKVRIEPGGAVVHVDRGDGTAVAWIVDGNGTLLRAERGRGEPPVVSWAPPKAGAPRWPGVGRRLSFEWDGLALTVRGADAGADRAGGLRLVSQVCAAAAPAGAAQ